MRMTHSTVSASARGKLLRCTRAIRASPSAAFKVKGATGFFTPHPLQLGPHMDTAPPTSSVGHQVSDQTGVTVACNLVKPSEIRTSGADDGGRRALRDRTPQAKTVLAQDHQEASAWLE